MVFSHIYCVVPGCSTNADLNPEEIFFCLPTNKDLLRRWVSNMNCVSLLEKSVHIIGHHRICSAHFTSNCFQIAEKKKLNRGVVPTILSKAQVEHIPTLEITSVIAPSSAMMYMSYKIN